MGGNVWYNGELVRAVVVVNSGIPITAEQDLSPWQDGYKFDTVFIVNPSG